MPSSHNTSRMTKIVQSISVLQFLVPHRADEEFVVHTLDAHRGGCDATRLVLDRLGTDAADQRHHPLRGAHVDVPRLDIGVGDELHLDLRADHYVVDLAADRPLADREVIPVSYTHLTLPTKR